MGTTRKNGLRHTSYHLIYMYYPIVFLFCLGTLLPGCLVDVPPTDISAPSIRVQIVNTAGQPFFNAPNPTFRGQGCVFIPDEAAQIQVIFSDSGGMFTASILALNGDIGEFRIQPDSPDVRGVPSFFGGDDTLTLQFADRDGQSLNGAVVDLSISDLPAFLHVEARDRNGNLQQFADTIILRPVGGAAGGSCAGG